MLKKLALGSGLALFAIGIAVTPVLAYFGTPGATCATSSITVTAGGTVTFTAHFLGGPGQTVTFSASGGGPGTTVTFNPPTAVTNATGDVTTQVTFSQGSSGNVTLTGTIGAQNCGVIEAVTAFPAASSLPLGLPVSFAWIAVLLVGVGLVGAAVLGGRRRRVAAPKSDVDRAA
jgi:hypothetical protein